MVSLDQNGQFSSTILVGGFREVHYGSYLVIMGKSLRFSSRWRITNRDISIKPLLLSGKDMEVAIENMNNAKIDGRIISVSKARFPAPRKKPFKSSSLVAGGEEKSGADRGASDDLRATEGVQILNKTIGFDSRTFKDVLLGKSKPISTNNSLEDRRSSGEEKERSNSLFDLYILVKDIAWIDLSIAGSVAERDDAWSKREVGLSYWFEHLEPLRNCNGVPAAFMFISLIGVPLHCWHESFFAALGNRWGSFVAIDTETKNGSDLSTARMVIRAESPFDIPSSIKVRSLGRIFTIKISLGNYQKPYIAVDNGGEVGQFADEWPSDNIGEDNERVVFDSHSHSSSPGMDEPSKTPIHRVVTDKEVHEFDENSMWPARRANVDSVGYSGEKRWDAKQLSSGQAQMGFGQMIRQEVENTNSVSLIPVDGPFNQALVMSSEPTGRYNFSPSFEFVLDSFDGLDTFSIRKGGSCESGEGRSGGLGKSCEFVRCTPRRDGLGFYNSAYRRAIRLTIRDSLEEMDIPAEDANLGSKNEEHGVMKESKVVYEEAGFEDMVISSILNVSGRQGKVGVLKVLRNAKTAIKEWVGTKNNLSGKSKGAIELEIKQLEQLQVQGLGDSNSLRQIVVLRGDGKYSVKSLVSKCLDFSSFEGGWRSLVWRGIAPLKVEVFTWLAIRQRIPVKVELVARGGLVYLDAMCYYLGLSFCLSRRSRNDIIFANGRLDVVQLFYLIRTRVAMWYKTKFSDCSCTVDELISDPSVADSLSFSLSKVRKKLSWEVPPCGFLKLNVDGAMVGNGGKGGIGGLLRNNLGICLEKFSLLIGPSPPILAELEAILHGLKFFFSYRWCEKFRLVLECDCLTTIDWISNASPCPQAFDLLVKSCRDLINANSDVLRHIPRYINLEADSLAKKGIG
ncbi:hypothetical protein V6N11_077857 [Hibiscus sabdariffa]|uniref:RNase H type-1 domain-containing protein n=1 Tax=Hibiscus sabdariffa TaxID=183260 RepID=A0ABR2TF75_9ROSI